MQDNASFKKEDGRTVVKFQPFIETFFKDDDIIITVLNLAIKDGDKHTLADAFNHFRDKKDYEAALKYLRLAADQSYGPSMFEQGKILLAEENPLRKTEGLEYIQKAAGLQDPSAITFIAESKAQKRNGAFSLQAEQVLTYLADWGFKPAKEALNRLQREEIRLDALSDAGDGAAPSSQEQEPDFAAACRSAFKKKDVEGGFD